MEVISSRIIEDEALEIDDKTFIDCTFINCVLEYSGRPVMFEKPRCGTAGTFSLDVHEAPSISFRVSV